MDLISVGFVWVAIFICKQEYWNAIGRKKEKVVNYTLCEGSWLIWLVSRGDEIKLFASILVSFPEWETVFKKLSTTIETRKKPSSWRAKMAKVHITNVVVLDNPSSFFNPFQFELTFECIEELKEDLEWKMIYVGSAESEAHDQILDTIYVGPVPEGRHIFVFQADPPDVTRIPGMCFSIQCWM